MRLFMDTYQPDTFMYISDWGSVGAGLPIALGAKLARPKQPVMAVVGDMGMMCNIGELETAMRERIPVVCVVFNDRGLGNERAFQKELYGGRIFGVDYSDVDFAALARVFGAFGGRVQDAANPAPALRSGAARATIGTEVVASAERDGYTLMVQSMTNQAMLPATVRKLAFDPVADFAPITQITPSPMIVVAHPSLAAASMAELVAFARANP